MNEDTLLAPRLKVLIDYPHSPFKVGEILENIDDNALQAMYLPYPHIFQQLKWWEERKENQMPQFVKYHQMVYKVEKHFVGLHGESTKVYDGRVTSKQRYELFKPATEFEYNEFRKLK